MVVKYDDKLFHFRRVKSPRYLIRVGFDVYTADTQADISLLLNSFVSADDIYRVEVIELASFQRCFNEVSFGGNLKGE